MSEFLHWSEPDVIECLGVPSVVDEDAASYSFTVAKDGLRLLLTLFPHLPEVCLSLYRDGIVEPVFDVQLRDCSHVRPTMLAAGVSALDCGWPDHPTTKMGIDPVLSKGIRIFVEPHIRIEVIQ